MPQAALNPSRIYAAGRNSVWLEQGPACPFTDPQTRKWWQQGRRDALAEQRLDADTEWDAEDFEP